MSYCPEGAITTVKHVRLLQKYMVALCKVTEKAPFLGQKPIYSLMLEISTCCLHVALTPTIKCPWCGKGFCRLRKEKCENHHSHKPIGLQSVLLVNFDWAMLTENMCE